MYRKRNGEKSGKRIFLDKNVLGLFQPIVTTCSCKLTHIGSESLSDWQSLAGRGATANA